MERIEMSQEERDKLEWLKRAKDKVISQREAGEKMGVSDRWVRKLLKRMKKGGDGVVVHGLRGRTSNRKISTKVQAQTIELLKQPEWHDFGPTFASQQLAKRYSIEVSDETLRGWMIEAGLWKPGSRRIEDIHCWRPRRSGFGELVQWDTCDHDWLEGRGPVRYLVRLIDDATSWSWGRFVERDATPFNMAVLWEYIDKNGRMVDVYTDRHSMFTVQPRPGESREQQRAADRLTQLGRALRQLGIGSILALSPQAKGRIERSFRTAQDRLVKDLRLARISTMEAANAFLETEYWPEWNARFAQPVEDFPNQHRGLSEQLELAAILCHVEQRVIGNDYTFSFAGRRYQIARPDAQAAMRHQRLRLELCLDGELKARYQQRYLNIAECGARLAAPESGLHKPVPKDHNAGGKSSWMQGFFDRPSPPLWKLLGDA
jgi:biotin operon repressor